MVLRGRQPQGTVLKLDKGPKNSWWMDQRTVDEQGYTHHRWHKLCQEKKEEEDSPALNIVWKCQYENLKD